MSANYRYAMDKEKNILTLTPTIGTYVGAFAPLVITMGGLVAFTSFAKHQARKNYQIIDGEPE